MGGGVGGAGIYALTKLIYKKKIISWKIFLVEPGLLELRLDDVRNHFFTVYYSVVGLFSLA